jgi:hypothetical protein
LAWKIPFGRLLMGEVNSKNRGIKTTKYVCQYFGFVFITERDEPRKPSMRYIKHSYKFFV